MGWGHGGILGVVVGLGGSALAADLPPSPPPRAPAVYVPAVLPVYYWAGIYCRHQWRLGLGQHQIYRERRL
jgi:hypothetical protein